MISEIEYDGIFFETVLLKFFELIPDHLIHLGDHVIILGPVLSHLGMIGVVRGYSDLGRIMDLLMGPLSNLAFMRDGEVENGKKGTFLGPVSPMPFLSTFMPDLSLFHQVIVLLGIVGTIISQFPQVSGVHLEIGRQTGHAPHMFRSSGRWIHPGNDRGTGRGTNRGIGDGPGINHSFFCKGVEVRGGGVVIAIAPEMGPVILAGDPKNVG